MPGGRHQWYHLRACIINEFNDVNVDETHLGNSVQDWFESWQYQSELHRKSSVRSNYRLNVSDYPHTTEQGHVTLPAG